MGRLSFSGRGNEAGVHFSDIKYILFPADCTSDIVEQCVHNFPIIGGQISLDIQQLNHLKGRRQKVVEKLVGQFFNWVRLDVKCQ